MNVLGRPLRAEHLGRRWTLDVRYNASMSLDRYPVGTLVLHPNRPEWGPGRVVHSEPDAVHVFFRDQPENRAKRLRTTFVKLHVCESQTDAVLDDFPDVLREGDYFVFAGGWRPGMPNYCGLWAAIAGEFNGVAGATRVVAGRSPSARFLQYPAFADRSDVHYEWLLRTSEGQLEVALHVELNDQTRSLEWLRPVCEARDEIARGVEHPFVCGPFGDQSAHVAFVIAYRFAPGTELRIAPVAAHAMHLLVERTAEICQCAGARLWEIR